MSLTAAQISQVYEILGVPQGGAGEIVGSIATLFGPAVDAYDMSAIVTRIDAKISALSAEQIDRVTALLSRHAAIGSSSPLQVSASSGGARGTLADHPAERETIRTALGNLLGVAVPSGGFIAEAKRAAQGAGKICR
jgi:hypothetical protein